MDYPVRVVARGQFGEHNIAMQKQLLGPLPEKVTQQVEQVWQAELKHNPNLTPGPLLTTRSVERIDRKHLLFTCGESNYKNFMGTTHQTVACNITELFIHRATGMQAVTVTKDGCLLLGVRSPKIDWPLLRHVVPAGRLRPDEQNLFTGIRSEFAEELGLQASDLTELICVGVVADETWGRLNFEFVFLARTRLTARQTIERARTAKSAEHCQLEPFPWYGQLLPDLLLADPNGFVPTGWAGIVLCLWHVFGSTIIPEWVTVHRSYEEHMGHRLAMAQL